MDRRNFMRTGAVGASGFAVAGGAPLNEAAQRGGSLLYSMDDYLEQVDEGLARIDEWTIDESVDESTDADVLGRKIVKSLYMTAMFRDLDVEDQLHPGMQDRMWAMQDTMDEAMDGVVDLLDRQTPESLERVRAALRDDASIKERIARFFDLEGGRTGVQDKRLEQTRASIDYVTARLSSQPPALLIEEYREKVEKVVASDIEAEARQRWLLSKVGEKTFWSLAQAASKRQDRIDRGLRGMGIGLLIAAGGAALFAIGADVGLVGMTVGAIWFVIGLVTLLVGTLTPESAT